MRNTNVQLKTYNSTTITQLGICKVKKKHINNNKFIFVIALENGQGLLGMPYVKIGDILTINCNTIGTQEADRVVKCNTKIDSDQRLVGE